jgi:DNA (cytosine-5)-methyltransferase 1
MDSLVVPTRLWPTATTKDAQSSGTRKNGFTLTDRTVRDQQWATPMAQDAGWRGSTAGYGLRDESRNWATPVARDYRAPHASDFNDPLPLQATGHQTEATAANGRVSLNPLFVEWLMGWPRGWTDCGSRVTGWSRWLRQSRSYAFAIACSTRS